MFCAIHKTTLWVIYFLVLNCFTSTLTDGKIEERKETCNLDGSVHNKTVLTKGMLAGKLKRQQGIDKIDKCIDNCCNEKRCHVALMMGNICYSMECANKEGCQPKEAPASIIGQNPRIAYVKRGTITMGKALVITNYGMRTMCK